MARVVIGSGRRARRSLFSRPYACAMSYRFTRHIVSLCGVHKTDIFELGRKLAIEPALLLAMINGKTIPAPDVIHGLARELNTGVQYLEKLVQEIKQDQDSSRRP